MKVNTVEQFQIKFAQRDNQLKKREKLGKMNRYDSMRIVKKKHNRNNDKKAWLDNDD